MFTLTGENNNEDDCNINEEELKVSQVAEDLRNDSNNGTEWHMHDAFPSCTFLKKRYAQNRAEWR